MKRKIVFGAALLVLALAAFVLVNLAAFDASLRTVYAVPPPALMASTDAAVIARGQHLAESIGGCLDCHAADLGGKLVADMGPVARIYAPNISDLRSYTDGELARLLRDGVRNDGTGILFMPTPDFRWWPDDDVVALISWLRAQKPVARASEPTKVKPLGKLLDRFDKLTLDITRRIDHQRPRPSAPAPAPTAAYGEYLAKACQGCHGMGFAGGPIPGAPKSMAVPTNLTPHETGLGRYSEEAFYKTLTTGVRPDGSKLDPLMPVATMAALNDVERKALWEFFRSAPAKPFGSR